MYAHRYKPYNSDSDSSTSDSESSESSDSTDSEMLVEGFQGADFTVLAEGLAKPPAEDLSGGGAFGFPITDSSLIKPAPSSSPPKAADPPLFESTSQSITNVIMLDSTNRDIKAYPQPTNLSLRAWRRGETP